MHPRNSNINHYPPERAEIILDTMLQQVDSVIEKVSAQLPKQFPAKFISQFLMGCVR